MSIDPIGVTDDLPLAPEYLELVEIINEVPSANWCSTPREALREIFQKRSPDNVLADPAFPYLYSFLKKRPPTVGSLMEIRSMSNHYTAERFTEWARQMSDMYYPVLSLLEMHAQNEFNYRDISSRLEDLTENIIRSLSPDATAYHQKPSGLSPDEEMTIVLACAQFANIPEVFPHSPLLVPDHYSGHWKRFISDERSECLLTHGHSPKVMHNLLSAKSYKSVDDVLRLFHIEVVPSMMSGVL